jgi:hypothetical protein
MKAILFSFPLACLLLSVYIDNGQEKHKQEQKVYDFKKGDIVIKPNHNWLPGTTFFEGGNKAGHAVIVLEDANDTNLVSLLKKTIVFESNARDVPEPDQLRRIDALEAGRKPGDPYSTFSENNKNGRYRLRPNLKPQQVDSIINFIVSRDKDISQWRSIKQFKTQPDYHINQNWYCTLIIWQAYYNILGIDLDANKGLIVYPNDILNSPFFSVEGSITRF